MNNTKQGTSNPQGNQSQQVTGQGKLPQSQLETIIRQGKFNSQSDANSYLQPHGLSCQMKDDGTAEIFEGVGTSASNRVATVRFQGAGKDQQSIGSIDY